MTAEPDPPINTSSDAKPDSTQMVHDANEAQPDSTELKHDPCEAMLDATEAKDADDDGHAVDASEALEEPSVAEVEESSVGEPLAAMKDEMPLSEVKRPAAVLGKLTNHTESPQGPTPEPKVAVSTAPSDALAVVPVDGVGDNLIGEWRRVEDIITIVRTDGVLMVILDAAQPPLELVPSDDGQWQARRQGTDEPIYDITVGMRDSLEIRKGDMSCTVFRIARSRTILGDWYHPGKVLKVVDVGSTLELRSEGRPQLKVIRRKIMEWEARRDSTGEAVYVIDHMEGTQKLTIRRPRHLSAGGQSNPPIEFCRDMAASVASHSRPHEVPRPGARRPRPFRDHADLIARREPFSRHRERRKRSLSGSRGRKLDKSPHEELEEFITKNELSDRVVVNLKKLSKREQRNVMGLDGGRNSFVLIGAVRNPSAVVMSRMKRLEQARSPSRDRSRSRWRHSSSSSGPRDR